MLKYLILGLLVSSQAHAGWLSYDDYDDCMLGRMKGQDRSMYSTADKACKKQFKVEFSIYTDNIKWQFSHDSEETVVELEPNDDYLVNWGKFSFSDKKCSEVKDADLGPPVEIRFAKNVGKYFSMTVMRCARALDFRGLYK